MTTARATRGMSEFHYRLMLVFVLALVIAVGRYLSPESFHLVGSDEYYYLQYAQHVAQRGAEGVQDLVQWYAQSPENRYHPSPARLVYLFLTAGLVKHFGAAYSVLVSISYVSFILFVGVCFYYSRKLLSREESICFLLIMCASPLTLGMSCVALSESFLNLLWGCTVWSFMDYLQRRSPAKMVLIVLFVTLSLLVKESSALLLVFMTVFMLSARVFKLRVETRDMVILCGAPVVLVLAVYWSVLGGWENFAVLMRATYMTHFVDKANAYALNFSGGPWFRYFVDFMLLSPVITLVAAGYAVHLLLGRSRDWKRMYFLIYFAVIYFPLSFLQHTKVVRFVINLEMVMALFCMWAVLDYYRKDLREGNWLWALLTLFVITGVSFSSFFNLFAVASVLDPITYHLVQVQNFIP